MPADRHIFKTPVALRYEGEGEDMDMVAGGDAPGDLLPPAAPSCTHHSCRNNPACSAPYDRDCTPLGPGCGMPPGYDPAVSPAGRAGRVLLHSCCAPCSGAMIEEMAEKGLAVTVFFYNPNIHPRREYDIRKEENKRYAAARGIPFVDCDYDAQSWFQRMKGLELDPERGARCTACFDMRMEVTAAYAAEHGFGVFTTTNATSRWKDVQQVNGAGVRAAARYADLGLVFWLHNWQTDAMTLRKYEVSAEQRFYKQEYCGCSFSLRDSNLWRKKEGIPPVRIGGEAAGLGTRYFEDPRTDAAEESQEVVDQFFADAAEQFGDERLRKQFEGRKKDAASVALNNW
jgi:predicted adenine nucleotide alpha hydrolase (AANH) superfamily ATPase